MTVLAPPDQRWRLDCVHDERAAGRGFRVLTIVDDVTRACRVATIDTAISGRRVVRKPGDPSGRHGVPTMMVSDDRTELTNAVPVRSGMPTSIGTVARQTSRSGTGQSRASILFGVMYGATQGNDGRVTGSIRNMPEPRLSFTAICLARIAFVRTTAAQVDWEVRSPGGRDFVPLGYRW